MQETRQHPDLARFTDRQLREELATRAEERMLGIKGPRPRYATKLEWAQAELASAQKVLDEARHRVVPAGPKRSRWEGQVRTLGDNVRKFEGLVKRYTESGE